MAEISVKNLKQATSGAYESARTLGLSAQKCEHGAGLCSEEFQGRKADMSIMEWPRQGQGDDNVTRSEVQLSVNTLMAREGVLLNTPSVRTSRASSMSSVSWGDNEYESPTLRPEEPVNFHHQKPTGPWTSLIQNMGRSKKEKQLRRTAEKITIQVEPPGYNEEYNLETLSNTTQQVRNNRRINKLGILISAPLQTVSSVSGLYRCKCINDSNVGTVSKFQTWKVFVQSQCTSRR